MHAKTSSWDVCAPEALITHSGGRVSDYLGRPLVYSRSAATVDNDAGVVVSGPHASAYHADVCRELRSPPPGFWATQS